MFIKTILEKVPTSKINVGIEFFFYVTMIWKKLLINMFNKIIFMYISIEYYLYFNCIPILCKCIGLF